MEYLIETYGPQLAPTKTDKKKYLEYKYWLYFGEGMYIYILSRNIELGCIDYNTAFCMNWMPRFWIFKM